MSYLVQFYSHFMFIACNIISKNLADRLYVNLKDIVNSKKTSFALLTKHYIELLFLFNLFYVSYSTDYYVPTKRYHHSTHIVGEYLYMWGGGIEGLPRVHNNKVKRRMTSVIEVFHLTTGIWEQRLTKGKPPLGVWAYVSTVIGNNIYYFGGRCNHDECYHNSLNSLVIDSLTWNELFSTSSKKGPMMKAGCGMISVTFDSEDYLLVVGGWGHPPNTRQPGAQYSGIGHVRTNEHHYYELTSGKKITISHYHYIIHFYNCL